MNANHRKLTLLATAMAVLNGIALAGNAANCSPRAEIVWTRTICKSGYIGWPSVCRLQSGDLMAVFSGGRKGHICPYGKVQMTRSTDNGETWSEAVTLADGPLDDRDAGIVQLNDGTIVVTYFTSIAFNAENIVKKHPEYREFYNRLSKEEIAKALGYFRMVSKDNGKTWSKPEKMAGVSQTPHGPILMNDGSLLQIGRSYGKDDAIARGHETRSRHTIISVWRSTDAGANWECLCPEIADTNGDNSELHMFHEPHVVQLRNGDLIGMVRCHREFKGNGYLRQTVSHDGGKTWSPMVKTDILGLPPHLIELPDGKVVCVYGRRNRDKTIGEFAVLSDDGGKTWDTENEITLCEAFNPDLGYPSSCLLPDGTILTAYYQKPSPGEPNALMATKWRVASSARAYPNMFSGGWANDVQFMDTVGSPYLLAHGLGHRVSDAKAKVRIPESGEYRVWVRTRTWVKDEQERSANEFRVAVGGKTLDKTFGLEGDLWHWEDGGTITLTRGETEIALKDLAGFDARCAGVLLTTGREKPQGALSINDEKPSENVAADLVVVGGGVPGTCAAIAAARSGLKVVLVQDRPVLGGNASSEIRVWCAGELCNDIVKEVRGRFMNMEAEASIADRWRQRVVEDETNIDCRLSYRAFGVEKNKDRITAVKALDLKRNHVVRFSAPLFVDATGDGWVGYWAGADYRMGREAAKEHDEPMAPEKADRDTLGASLMWTSYRASNDEPFSAPWAEPWAQGVEAIHGEWNWEYGIHRDVLTEGEAVRDRLLLAIYGAFSLAKRHPENCRQVLNFVPYLLGKRESRRLMGDWVLSEKDVTGKREFEDAISKGSWSVDLHYDTCKEGVDYLTVCKQPHFGRYYIPFRSVYSRNVPNLMMAGRCFSCTHVGLGGPRVINTLAMLGVACGYAAAECRQRGILPRDVYRQGLVRIIQRKIGGDWPGNPDPAKANWKILDDETGGMIFGKGWRQTFNSNGCTVNDKYSIGGAKSSEVTISLPIEKPGRYRLMRNVPFLPWHKIGGETAAALTSGGETRDIRFAALEHVGEWYSLGTYELTPGATLKILPSKSTGAIYVDGFAVVPER